jgi:hypothetical protein
MTMNGVGIPGSATGRGSPPAVGTTINCHECETLAVGHPRKEEGKDVGRTLDEARRFAGLGVHAEDASPAVCGIGRDDGQ